MILAGKKAQEPARVTEVYTIKLYRNAAVDGQSNGFSNSDERDSQHPVDHSKHLELTEGDAHAVYNYFCRMKLTNPNFFYLMDLDDEGRLRNVFWADPRSRDAYRYFCDTIAIDTTSLANKFELPLLSKIYTKEIFKRFQSEVEGMYSCFNTRQVNANGQIITYIVKERVEAVGSEKEVKYFEVLYETSQVDIRCICSLFNFKGYLCRHALNVLNYNGVEEIPARYILPRWSKDFKRKFPLDHALHNADVNSPMYWYNTLYNYAIQVVVEGAQFEEHYKLALQQVQELLKKFSLLEDDSVKL
ncbi:Zinc finger, SWIM-type [Dillenia turbinata]|uniref:Protein FAR1-RELATED SEQUENCE n=1 Tax=Dillenia turbinata TaxID=194707 RepID=A0AAN8VDZ6_9MAGN